MFLTPLTPAGKSSAFAGRRLTMQKYVCNVCGYEYDPAAGDPDSGIADVLTYMKGLRPLNRVGAAFGSYGWSGESPKIIQEWLASMNMDMPADPVKCLFVPKHEGLSQCVALGKTVAEALKAKC